MVEAIKNNESESESVQMNAKIGDELSKYIGYHAEREREKLWRAIASLINRIGDLEAELEAMQRGDNTGFKHENDGGWFE